MKSGFSSPGLIKAGRQMGQTIDKIRDDHVERYRWAAELVYDAPRIIDAGCGAGYGSWLLVQTTGAEVISIDVDPHILEFGRQHYGHPNIERLCLDLQHDKLPSADAVVAFEVLEHLEDAESFLHRLPAAIREIVGSVPNQDMVPFDPKVNQWHFRHYTEGELSDLLESCGWTIANMCGQRGKRDGLAQIGRAAGARTLVFNAVR